MPTNEKEYNGYLIDQLRLLKRIEEVTKDKEALEVIAFEREFIEQKLYQNPALGQNKERRRFHERSELRVLRSGGTGGKVWISGVCHGHRVSVHL